MIFKKINADIFEMFDMKLELKPYSDEKVDSRKGRYLGVSSDIYSSHGVSFLLLIGNIALIIGLNWIFNFLNRSNPFRQLIKS